MKLAPNEEIRIKQDSLGWAAILYRRESLICCSTGKTCNEALTNLRDYKEKMTRPTVWKVVYSDGSYTVREYTIGDISEAKIIQMYNGLGGLPKAIKLCPSDPLYHEYMRGKK